MDNLILAYHPRGGCTIDVGETNGVAHVNGDSKEGVIEWGGKNKCGALNDLKLLWKDLEQYAEEKKVCVYSQFLKKVFFMNNNCILCNL